MKYSEAGFQGFCYLPRLYAIIVLQDFKTKFPASE